MVDHQRCLIIAANTTSMEGEMHSAGVNVILWEILDGSRLPMLTTMGQAVTTGNRPTGLHQRGGIPIHSGLNPESFMC